MKILIDVPDDFQESLNPEDGTIFDVVQSALDHFEIKAWMTELKPDYQLGVEPEAIPASTIIAAGYDEVRVRVFSKLYHVTAVFTDHHTCNKYLSTRPNEGVIKVLGPFIFISNLDS